MPLKGLLEFATKKSHFIVDGDYYDQIDGVAMGSHLGPVLANIFMCHFEEKWVFNIKGRPSFWFRYVDKTFTLFDNKSNALQFLQYLNPCHVNIKFTIEFEENNVIPFRDVLIKRRNHIFSTSIYCKKTFTGLNTKWDSFTPRKYKVNPIRNLTFRCFRICSSPRLLQLSLDEPKKLLSQNGYPRGVVNYNMNDALQKQQNKPLTPTITVPKKKMFLVLPYLNLQSKIAHKQIMSCINKFYGCIDLRGIFQSTPRVKSFFPYKERLSCGQMAKIVYKAACWDCNDFYIRKTKRSMTENLNILKH